MSVRTCTIRERDGCIWKLVDPVGHRLVPLYDLVLAKPAQIQFSLQAMLCPPEPNQSTASPQHAPEADLLLCILWGVRAMHQVPPEMCTVVSSDCSWSHQLLSARGLRCMHCGAWGALVGIGTAHHLAGGLDHIHALPCHRHNGTTAEGQP